MTLCTCAHPWGIIAPTRVLSLLLQHIAKDKAIVFSDFLLSPPRTLTSVPACPNERLFFCRQIIPGQNDDSPQTMAQWNTPPIFCAVFHREVISSRKVLVAQKFEVEKVIVSVCSANRPRRLVKGIGNKKCGPERIQSSADCANGALRSAFRVIVPSSRCIFRSTLWKADRHLQYPQYGEMSLRVF